MPLESGSSREVVGHNIQVEEEAGKPRKQAIAIALNKAGLSRSDKLSAIMDGVTKLHARMDALCRKDGSDEPGNGDEPYGDTEYADPGYQADKKKRYQIDTKDRIRSAWDYLHKRRDEDKYTPEQFRKVREHIIAAWKKKIDPKGPPEAR